MLKLKFVNKYVRNEIFYINKKTNNRWYYNQLLIIDHTFDEIENIELLKYNVWFPISKNMSTMLL